MGKPDKPHKELTAFQRFEKFTKALIVVPSRELKQQRGKYKRRKNRKKVHSV